MATACIECYIPVIAAVKPTKLDDAAFNGY